jgi:hypothetical protein
MSLAVFLLGACGETELAEPGRKFKILCVLKREQHLFLIFAWTWQYEMHV